MIHIVMYPWFGIGHITSFLHLSNKLAEKGHRVSFFIPTRTCKTFRSFNLHPHLISFVLLDVPPIHGLPLGSETTSDIPFTLHPLLMTAMDHTKSTIESFLLKNKPDFVFFDFTHWMPSLARKYEVKSVHYCTISPATVGYLVSPERKIAERGLTESALLEPPKSFPVSSIKLRKHEAKALACATRKEFGNGVSFMERQNASFSGCDAICFRTYREIEGRYCDYVETQFSKPVLLAGPLVLDPPGLELEAVLSDFLNGFKLKSVIFCALGSECVLDIEQFQELLLGLEITGLPFLAALKPPYDAKGIDAALPDGLKERTRGRGLVHGGWVKQSLILKHPCVGCFITHCGCGSLSEAMANECQLVLLPQVGDQIINARLMGGDLKIGVEVKKGDEDGLFARDDVCDAVNVVMNPDSEVGKEIRRNRAKLRELMLNKGQAESCIDALVANLHDMLK